MTDRQSGEQQVDLLLREAVESEMKDDQVVLIGRRLELQSVREVRLVAVQVLRSLTPDAVLSTLQHRLADVDTVDDDLGLGLEQLQPEAPVAVTDDQAAEKAWTLNRVYFNKLAALAE